MKLRTSLLAALSLGYLGWLGLPDPAPNRATQCAAKEAGLPGGASARWEAFAERATDGVVQAILDGPPEEALRVQVEAVGYFGGARIELLDEIWSLGPGEIAHVPVDLRRAVNRHEAQTQYPTLVRVRSYALDASGQRSGRFVELPDLIVQARDTGSVEIRRRRATDDFADRTPSLGARAIRAMREQPGVLVRGMR